MPTTLTPGRPRDAARDTAILQAAGDLLAEVGYDAMSMDAVAARAGVSKATIYRRWPGKADLVLATIRARDFFAEEVPDTGDLRGDLLALFDQARRRLEESSFDHLAGVLAALRRAPDLARPVREQLLGLWSARVHTLVERAADRGEVRRPDGAALELLAQIGPSLVAVQVLLEDEPLDAAFFERLVDCVLLPSLRSR
ncbi:MAG TPA: TetR/AcrR family transcriptional regulator [Baekduia sp.]|nr:TetR/AcrR family transcriptional regulator [Baekduia sp.]